MTILVTGGSGDIGRRIVAGLAVAGQPVRATSRELAKLQAPAGVETAELDLTRPDSAVLRDVDTMFLYTARASTDEFLAAAREAGVRYAVLLSSPAAYEAGEYDRPIGMAHRVMERSLENSGLPHTVVYPSWLATNARRDWGPQISAEGRAGIAFPDAQVNPIHPGDVAEVVVRLLTGDAHRGLRQVLTGPASLRLREIAAVLGAPVDELTREQALARRPEWLPEPILDTLLDVTARAVGVTAPVTNTVERITGRPARSFAEWAKAEF